jgi:hypothetical protein
MRYQPSLQPPFAFATLRPITAVEIVALEWRDARAQGGVGEFLSYDRILDTYRIDGDSAQELAGLWRALPSGRGQNCFHPAYGFRFFAETRLVLKASVSWRCNQARLAGRSDIGTFDGSSAEAQSLLALCRSLLPPPPRVVAEAVALAE